MKKTFPLLTLVAAATFALSACTVNVPTPATETPEETSSVETPEPATEAPTGEAELSGGYQEIYDTYATRLQHECPNLSMTECAELSNEGVSEMAKYMYKASGKDGQIETYTAWAEKLMDVYMAEAR